MKKFLFGSFLGIFALAGTVTLATQTATQTTQTGFATGGSRQNQNRGYNANVAGSDKFQGDSLIKTIQTAINWVLGILSMIALVLCLWGGFQMMTSGGDQAKYQKGLDVLKWAAIGLAIIACSWLIVSLIFFIIQGSIGETSGNKVTPNTPQ